MARMDMIAVDPNAVAGIYGQVMARPAIAYLGIDNGQPVCIGGLVWGENGRCTLWFDYGDEAPKRPWAVLRWAKRLLRYAIQVGEKTVYAGLDETQPNAERLMKALGFRFFETEQDVNVYVWEAEHG